MSSSDVDDAVLALLAAHARIVLWEGPATVVGDLVPLFDGHVEDSDEAEKTIGAPLPYLIFYSTPGRPARPRVGRASTAREVEFQVTGVGTDRWQTKWVSELAESILDDATITPAGDRARRILRTDDNLFIARDDTWTRPGGEPLFMCPARYTAGTKR